MYFFSYLFLIGKDFKLKRNPFFFLFLEIISSYGVRPLLMIALYHQTKTPVGFKCRQGLNPRSLIQSMYFCSYLDWLPLQSLHLYGLMIQDIKSVWSLVFLDHKVLPPLCFFFPTFTKRTFHVLCFSPT